MANTPAPNELSKPGVSIHFGPADDGDVEMPDADVNGTVQGKRKSRSSAANKSYLEQESSEEEDDEPLVRHYPQTALPDASLSARLTLEIEQASSYCDEEACCRFRF